MPEITIDPDDAQDSGDKVLTTQIELVQSLVSSFPDPADGGPTPSS